MSESLIDAREMEHLRWLATYGGGDELADANCWRDAKPALQPLLEALDAARSLHAGLTCAHDPMDVDERIALLGVKLERFAEVSP